MRPSVLFKHTCKLASLFVEFFIGQLDVPECGIILSIKLEAEAVNASVISLANKKLPERCLLGGTQPSKSQYRCSVISSNWVWEMPGI